MVVTVRARKRESGKMSLRRNVRELVLGAGGLIWLSLCVLVWDFRYRWWPSLSSPRPPREEKLEHLAPRE
jgi:hypothetical protein